MPEIFVQDVGPNPSLEDFQFPSPSPHGRASSESQAPWPLEAGRVSSCQCRIPFPFPYPWDAESGLQLHCALALHFQPAPALPCFAAPFPRPSRVSSRAHPRECRQSPKLHLRLPQLLPRPQQPCFQHRHPPERRFGPQSGDCSKHHISGHGNKCAETCCATRYRQSWPGQERQ